MRKKNQFAHILEIFLLLFFKTRLENVRNFAHIPTWLCRDELEYNNAYCANRKNGQVDGDISCQLEQKYNPRAFAKSRENSVHPVMRKQK